MPTVALALSLFLLPYQNEVSVDQIVRDVRVAVTYDKWIAKPNAVRLTGNSFENGIDGKYSLQFDNKGRWLQKTESFLGSREGSDGKTFWTYDWTGVAHDMAFSSLDQSRLMMMVYTNKWLTRDGVEVSLDKQQMGPDGYTLNLTLTDSRAMVKLVIAKDSHLPTKAIQNDIVGDITTEFSDWKTVGELRVPFSMKTTNNGITSTMTIKSGEPIDPSDTKAYNKPKPDRSNTKYKNGAAKLECMRTKTGHMLVRPLINGKDMGWFIFDSGAGAMCINKSTAEELKLETVGKVQVVGAGGAGESSFRRVNNFSLGEVEMTNTPFVEIELDPIGAALGVKIAGIVGRDLFYKTLVEIDGPHSQIYVYNPNTYPKRVKWLKTKIDKGMPAVEGSFEKGSGWFGVDSGGDEVVLFHSPTVQRLDLLKDRKVIDSAVGGYAGNIPVKIGAIDWFQIGELRLDKPKATFSLAKNGVLANRYLMGDIGQALMKNAVVVFDLGREQMAFVKP